MKDYKKYINALRKCAKEHENDRTFTGHIIVSDLCRDTANLLEELEQEPKTGHWIFDYTATDGHRVYHCSKCGCYLKPKHSEPLCSFKWCSLCGARMVEPQERSDKE